ncbi:MAG: S-layer homology domain-containing protein [Oscillospiraceae bacterium]|nr:S-layer homology domain-containing protein [Oscillospiraceae bacterium]
MRRFFQSILCLALCLAPAVTALAVEEAPSPYADVSAEDTFYDAVSLVHEKGIMNGVGEGLFAPQHTTDRAALVTALWRLAGEPVVNYAMRFSDVAEDAWYAEAVRWAASAGIASGYDDMTFAPHDALTREQLCVMVYRYEQLMGGGFSGAWMFLLAYPDAMDVSDWAYEAVCWMSMHQLTTPTDAPLVPQGSVTRGGLAGVLAAYTQIASR